ncbi:MAG: hypothetical protein EXS25_06035 [Pedosphaera sp.]|nr:hypothetical protein [Pedosphaera sp.]
MGFEGKNGSSTLLSNYRFLPTNAAGSDTDESVIPWTQYSVDWTLSADVTGASFYWSGLAHSSGHTANVVMDNVSLTQLTFVPEAETIATGIFISGLMGAAWYRRFLTQAYPLSSTTLVI